MPPFGLDPARQTIVGARPPGAPPAWLSPRHRLVLALFGFGLVCVGGLAGACVAAFAAGARHTAALFGLATLAAAPLPLLGPLQDWWRHRRR